jgi:hypothetical protein
MKTPARRTRIGRSATIGTRETVYQTPDGIEVDSAQQFEVVRQRVLYEDIRMVTYHRQRGVAFLVTTGILSLFMIFMGVAVASIGGDSWIGALIFFAIALPVMIGFLLRAVLSVDIITVYGRRSKAVIRFPFRKVRARELYGTICAAARSAQRVRPATFPGSAAQPLPADVPLPPLEQ